jgi:hypothetical protein
MTVSGHDAVRIRARSVGVPRDVHARLRAVVERAAAPHERADTCGFVARALRVEDLAELARREENWLRTAGVPSLDRAQLYRAMGVTRTEWRRRLRSVELTDAGRQPAWAHQFVRFMRGRFNNEAGRSARRSRRDTELLSPADAIATPTRGDDDAWRAILQETAAHVARDVMGDVNRALIDGFAEDAHARLAHVFASLSLSPAPRAASDWLARFESYPVAARALGVQLQQWLQHLREFLARLHADAGMLTDAFARGVALGDVVSYRGGLSDPHDGGRMVCKVTFASGVSLAYKPHDLRAAAAFDALVQRVELGGCEARRLRVPRTIAADGYGWQLWVEPAPCADTDAVARYFCHVGALTRLLQVLDATDCIAENLIAVGDQPQLIDLEGLLSPRAALAPSVPDDERALAELVWDTPLRVGLITAKVVGEPGRPAADLGAMAGDEQRAAPFGAAGARFSPATSLPRIGSDDAASVSPEHYVLELLQGYEAAARWLRSAGADVVRVFLTAVHAAPARFVYRNTHVYARLLASSLTPTCLADSGVHDASLARIWRAGMRTAESRALVALELAALRNFDVPVFHANAGSRSLVGTSGRVVPDFCEGTADCRSRDRLERMSLQTSARDADGMALALFVLNPALRHPGGSVVNRRATEPTRSLRSSASVWRSIACDIGEHIARHAPLVAPRVRTWTSLQYSPACDAWNFGPLAADLFSGAAGIALVFADLFAVSRRPAFREVAMQLVACLSRADALQPHGICGVPGALYALARLRHTLRVDIPALHSLAYRVLRAPPPQSDEYALGATGTIVCVTGTLRYLAEPHGALRADLSEACNRIVLAPEAECLGRPLATGHQGQGVSLSTLPGLRHAQAYAQHVRGTSAARITSTREPFVRTDASVGDLLAAIASVAQEPVRGHRAEARQLECDAYAVLASLARRSPCPDLDALVLTTALWELTGAKAWHARAVEIADRIVEHGVVGRWLAPSIVTDRLMLSGLVGVAGVAHALLRLSDPLAAPSLRLPS